MPVFGPVIKLHCLAAASQGIVYVCRPLLLPGLRQVLWYAWQHCALTPASGPPLLPLLSLSQMQLARTGHVELLPLALRWAADVWHSHWWHLQGMSGWLCGKMSCKLQATSRLLYCCAAVLVHPHWRPRLQDCLVRMILGSHLDRLERCFTRSTSCVFVHFCLAICYGRVTGSLFGQRPVA
jgi:hypothetical protein